MHLPAHRGATKAERLFILLLVLSFMGFSVWLKMLPNLRMNLRADAPPVVKLWVDPSLDADNHVKPAPVGSILCFIVLITPLVLRPSRPLQRVRTVKTAARDIFSESRQWYRPPPLF